MPRPALSMLVTFRIDPTRPVVIPPEVLAPIPSAVLSLMIVSLIVIEPSARTPTRFETIIESVMVASAPPLM
jgi:hypothetical protein